MIPKALCLVIVCSCWACTPRSSNPETNPDQSIEMTGVHFFAEDKGKPGVEVAKFDYRQKLLFFTATLNKTVTGKRGQWVFTAKETTVGNNQPIQTLDGNFDGNQMSAQIHLNNRPWPIGVYHVDVVIEEKTIGGFDFEVTGGSTPVTFDRNILAPDDGTGKIGKPVQSFQSANRTIHILVQTKGIDTTQPEVVWRLYHKVKGKDTEIANTTQPRMKLQDSVFQCQFTSPKDWDKGDYHADVFMNGKLAHSVPFIVK